MNTKRTIIILLITLLFVRMSRAQETSTNTTFSLYCFEVDSDMNATIHFGYSSTGGEHYIGSGFDFVTEAGEYPDAFTVALSPYDPYPALGLALIRESVHPVNIESTFIYVPLSVTGLRMCDQPATPSPLPPVEPAPTPCPFQAIDSSTGEFYCFQPLANGVVPLPSKPTNRQAS